jgi:hypothetical protein
MVTAKPSAWIWRMWLRSFHFSGAAAAAAEVGEPASGFFSRCQMMTRMERAATWALALPRRRTMRE